MTFFNIHLGGRPIYLFAFLFVANFTFAQCPTGDVTLQTQTQVDNLAANNCTTISGNLIIQQSGTSDLITDLSGLSTLTTIDGFLSVRDQMMAEHGMMLLL